MRSDRLSISAVVALLAAAHAFEVDAADEGFVSTVTVTRTLYGQPMGTPSQSAILETPSSSMGQKEPTVHHTLDMSLPSQFSSLPQIIESLFPTHAPSASNGNVAQPTAPASPREESPSKSMNKDRPPHSPVMSPQPISVPVQPAKPQMSSSSMPQVKEIHHTMMPLPGAPSAVPIVPISNPAANPSQPAANPSQFAPNPNQPSNPNHPPGAKPTHPGMAVPGGNPANNNMMHSLVSVNPGMMSGHPSGAPPMQTGAVPVVQVPLGNNNQQMPSSGSPLLQASSSVAAFNVWPTDLVPPPASSGMSSSARPSSSASASSSTDANNVNKKIGPSNNPISSGTSNQVVGSSLVIAGLMGLMAAFQ